MSLNLEGIKSGADKVVAPAKAFSDAVVVTTEKAVSLQMDSCKAYNDIVFKQLKKIPEINSLSQAGELFWGQIEPISEFNKQMLQDWKSLVALNTEFASALKSAFSNKDASATEPSKSAEATKPAEVSAAPQKPEAVKKITSAKRPPRTTKTANTTK